MSSSRQKNLDTLNREVCSCRKCPRLVEWREDVAQTKRAAFRSETYWGRPLPGFGDPEAGLLIIGLAPAAHGANRTGRMFTGDRSGEWLYRALYRAGFANQAESTSREDGLVLTGAYITAIVRCAPPANKPATEERDNCLPFTLREFELLQNTRVLLALGSFAWNGTLGILAQLGQTAKPKPRFGHAAECTIGPYTLLGSFHPSQQNTFTGRLTEPMFDGVFNRARLLLGGG